MTDTPEETPAPAQPTESTVVEETVEATEETTEAPDEKTEVEETAEPIEVTPEAPSVQETNETD